MDERITATKAARNMSELLSRVHYRGERFVIERGGEPVAALVPHVPAGAATTLSDLLHLLGELGSPDPAFADDLERVARDRSALPEDPWAS